MKDDKNIMSRHVLWVLCCGSAALAWGQEPLPGVLPDRLPMVDPLWGKPGRSSGGKHVDLEKLQADLQRLKAARQTLSQSREGAQAEIDAPDTDQTAELLQLRLRLGVLLSKLTATTTPKPAPEPPPDKADPLQGPFSVPHVGKTIAGASPLADYLSLAQLHFQSQDYTQAMQAFRQIDLTGLRAQEREPIRYLTAVCLKRLGKNAEAAALFREVANSKTDEVMASCAQWQLGLITWQSEVAAKLTELQKRQKALEK